MQRGLVNIGVLIADVVEDDQATRFGIHLEFQLREARATTARRLIEIHQRRQNPLAAVLGA